MALVARLRDCSPGGCVGRIQEHAQRSMRADFSACWHDFGGMTMPIRLRVHLCARLSIFDTLASFGPAWTEKQAFAAQLLSSLVADADKSASRTLSAEELYSLLAYVGCSAAICEACGIKCSSDPAG